MKFKRVLRRSFGNRKANPFINIIMSSIYLVLIIFIISYMVMSIAHTTVSNNLSRITSNMSDTIAQNKTITPAMMTEYKKSLDLNKFFMGDYTVEFIEMKYNKATGSFIKTTKGSSLNGASVGTITLESGTTIKVLVYGNSNNRLGELLSMIKPTTITSVSAGEAYVD